MSGVIILGLNCHEETLDNGLFSFFASNSHCLIVLGYCYKIYVMKPFRNSFFVIHCDLDIFCAQVFINETGVAFCSKLYITT